ncbi:MAG: ABC transporter ATP-binding protein, partial [Streptococcaceae bacterium]|nr:ABC transporter ATP-binding protein [Streptococcaceae bacterium]
MIELVDIYKSYQIDSTSFPVLKKINLMINPGEFVGIMGKSGSGKSTLINLIGLIDKKFEGLYRFNGESIASYSDNQLSQIRNEQVGFVFQNFSLIESKTVRENVELPLLYQGISHRNTKERVEAALEKV